MRDFRPPIAGFARKLFMASSAGKPRSTGSSREKQTDANKNPHCKIYCASAFTKFSGSTKFPPHAAVHETVELAKQNGFGTQAGFVNAILRGYLREFDETKKLLADLKISNPAIGFSHPQWLVEKWQKRFGEEHTRQLLEWNNTPPKTFARVNLLKL